MTVHPSQKARSETARRELLGSQLDRIAHIHSPRVKTVNVQARHGDPAPGWSSDGDIFLSANHLPAPTTVDDVAVWLGVLMHEVGHCEWSPRTIAGAPHSVYNLAEDARQEALVLEKLPGAVGSLTQAVGRLILKHPRASGRGTWPLIAGRTYLPASLRSAVRDQAVAEMGEDWTTAVGGLIARYMRLADPGYSHKDEAVEILTDLAALLDSLSESETIECVSSGRADAPIGGVDISEADVNDTGDAGDAGDGEGADGEGDGDEGDGGDGAGAGEGESEAGEGAGDGRNRIRDEAKKAAEPDEATQRQAKAILRRMREEQHRGPDRTSDGVFPPSSEARIAVARLSQHLKPFLVAAEAGLDRMTAGGRIRPDRIAAGYRPDHVFDKWQLDQEDAISAEVVVAVDVSGSMGSYMTALSEAVWVMRTVTAKTSAKLTVLVWQSNVDVMTAPLGPQVNELICRGGTNGLPMIEFAKEIFSESRMRRKWLIVMTDGQVAGGADVEKTRRIAKAIADSGVTVSVLEFGQYADGSVFGEHRQPLKRLAQMPELIGGLLRRVYQASGIR